MLEDFGLNKLNSLTFAAAAFAPATALLITALVAGNTLLGSDLDFRSTISRVIKNSMEEAKDKL